MAKSKMPGLASAGVSNNFDYKVVIPLTIVTMFCFGFLIARSVNPAKGSLDSSDNVKNKISKVASTPINLNKVSQVTITTQTPSSSASNQSASSSNGQSTVQPATTAAGQTPDVTSQIKTVSPQQATGTSESESMQALKLTAGLPVISNSNSSTYQNPVKNTLQIVNNTTNSLKSAL